MGFETSVVVTIFLVSTILIGTISYTILSSSHDLISSSVDEHYSLINKKLQTDVEIVQSNAIIYNSTYQLSLEVLNTGSETLESDELDVLVDGVHVPYSSASAITTWTPEAYEVINVYNLSGFGDHRVKLVTKNGISDYYSYSV